MTEKTREYIDNLTKINKQNIFERYFQNERRRIKSSK